MQKTILQTIIVGAALAAGMLDAPRARAQNGIPTGCEATQEGTPAYKKCVSNYNDAIAHAPDFSNYYIRGKFYFEQGLDDEAIADLSKAVPLGKESGRAVRTDYSNALFFLGLAYRHENLNDQAQADFTEVIALRPDFDQAYANRGNIYLNTGQYELAIPDFTRLISLRHDFGAYYNRGLAYDGGGHPDEAIADFTKVIALVPTFAYGYYNRGLAREHKGQRDEAITDYQSALGHDANLQAAKDGLTRLSTAP